MYNIHYFILLNLSMAFMVIDIDIKINQLQSYSCLSYRCHYVPPFTRQVQI